MTDRKIFYRIERHSLEALIRRIEILKIFYRIERSCHYFMCVVFKRYWRSFIELKGEVIKDPVFYCWRSWRSFIELKGRERYCRAVCSSSPKIFYRIERFFHSSHAPPSRPGWRSFIELKVHKIRDEMSIRL